MYRNFGGLAINQNYKDKLDELGFLLERDLIFEEELPLSRAFQPLSRDYCNIFYTERGTFLFLNIDMADHQYIFGGEETFSFFISQEQDTHFFNHIKNGSIVASEYVLNGVSPKPTAYQMITPQEDIVDISEGAIYKTLENVLGEDIRDIPHNAVCFRYRFQKKKPWWQFW